MLTMGTKLSITTQLENSSLITNAKRIRSNLSRRRRSINLSKINKVAKDNETIIVAGTVLGTGILTKKLTISAFKFSESAKKKLKDHMTIQELMKKNPKGKGLRILG